MRTFLLGSCLVGAILLSGSWYGLSHPQNTAIVPAAAKQELLKAAKTHKVKIKADKTAYVTNQKMTIVRAPIKGIEKYSEADFDKGAAVVLLIIKSSTKLAIPDGSYVVKLQYQRNAKSGKVIFTNAAGTVVAQRDRDLPILTLPDPDFPDRSDPGEILGIDNCAIYYEKFPQLVLGGTAHSPGADPICANCACTYYRRELAAEGIAPGILDGHAFSIGFLKGLFCASSTPLRCP